MRKADRTRKQKLTLYLAKGDSPDAGTVVKTADAEAPISMDVGGCDAQLYVRRERPGLQPPWTRLFDASPEVPANTFGVTKTIGAILLVRHKNRAFLLTFGMGYHLLNGDSVERDFGLRVALNAVDPNKLRSLDKASYDHNPLNSRTQSTIDADLVDLDLDAETEMLYAVTGVSQVPILGSNVTGRDALTLNVEIALSGIPALLDAVLTLYARALPKQFEWIDNVRRVKDPEIRETLDLLLNDALDSPDGATIWLGEPEIVDWESQTGYSFDLRPNTPRHVVLQLSELRAYLAGKGLSLTVDAVRQTTVHVNDANYEPVKSWSAYRCLYAEIPDGKHRYVLRHGDWYEVDADFVQEIDKSMSTIQTYGFSLPLYSLDREEDYNESVAAAHPEIHVMDKLTTAIGGRYDKVEFCDLIRNGTELIHVKFYRSSGTLSHLFAQGSVAAEAFVKDEGFRERLNKKLPAPLKLQNIADRPDARSYSVVFGIATTKALPEDLPFFSKVTLRNAHRTLQALGFDVRLAAIPSIRRSW